MVSLLHGLTESEPLLAFASPPDQQEAADILERIRADLHPGQPQLSVAALQLLDRLLGILQRYRAQAGEPRRVRRDHLGDVVVQQA